MKQLMSPTTPRGKNIVPIVQRAPMERDHDADEEHVVQDKTYESSQAITSTGDDFERKGTHMKK